MESNNFYNKLIENYIIVNIPKKYDDLGKIGTKISWYLADTNNSFISMNKSNNKNIVEIDIKSAYTSLCDIIFHDNIKFIEQIHAIDDKFERNVFISNSLKTTSKLKEFAAMSKIIIFGILMENYSSDIELLEIKKDSCIFLCNDNTFNKFMDIYNNTNSFTKFVVSNNIKFNITLYNKYYRINKTSIFLNQNDIIKKGNMKYHPEYITSELTNILIHNIINEDKLQKIYSFKFLTIIKENNLDELLRQYYVCENNKIISRAYTYDSIIPSNVYPYGYLTLFIYPAIISNKI